MRIAASLLCLALLTGCVGGGAEDEPVAPAEEELESAPAAAPTPRASTPPPATSEPVKPTSTSTVAPANQTQDEAEPAPTLTTVPFEWSSTLAAEACVPVAVLGCYGVVSSEGRYNMPTFDGSPASTKLELTWTAEPGGVAEMAFAVVRAVQCEGDGCWEGEVILGATGASPLSIETDIELAEGEFLVVAAQPASMFPDPLYGFVHTEQAFSVTGQFVVAK